MAAALVATLLFAPRPRGEEPAQPAHVTHEPEAPRPPREAPLPPDPEPRAAPPELAATEVRKQRKALIEAVEFSPQRPCVGEEVLVSVRLRPEARHAKTAIRGQLGSQAVFVFDAPGLTALPVMADDWVDGMDTRSAQVVVESCRAAPRLVLTSRRLERDRYEFTAVASEGPQPTAFRWRFAGGAWEDGRASVVHDFGLRAEDGASESMLIEAEAGPLLRGRTVLVLINEHFLTRAFGHAYLPVSASQFPERLPSGLRSTLDVRNLFSSDLTFEALRVKRLDCGAEGRATEVVLPASAVMSGVTVPSGGLAHLTATLPAELVGDACALELRLEGATSAEPFTALWGLSVVSVGSTVAEPSLRDRVLRAQRRLGRPDVTPDEVERYGAE